MVPDLIRTPKTPATGADAGNRSIVDYNLRVVDTLYIPVGEINSLNGGKDQAGAIRLTAGVLNSYDGSEWTAYASESPSGNYIYASPDDPQSAFIDVTGDIKSANYVEAGVSLRVGNAYIGGMLDTLYNNVLYGATRIRSGGSLEIESGDNAVLKLASSSGDTGNTGFWDMRYASFIEEAPLNFYRNTDLQLSLYDNQLYDGNGIAYAKASPSGDYIYASPLTTQNAYIDVQGTITSRTNLVSNGTLVVDGNASINGNGIYLPGVNSEFTNSGLETTNIISNGNITATGDVVASTVKGEISVYGANLSATNPLVSGYFSTYIDEAASALLLGSGTSDFAQIRYQPSILGDDTLGRPRLWINRNGGSGNMGVIAYTDDIPSYVDGKFILADPVTPQDADIDIDGNLKANSIIISDTPITSTSDYSILTRDDTSGEVKKITGVTTNPSAFTAGRIPYTVGANTLADSANLAWDNTNRVFILGGSRPTFRLNNTAGGAEIVNIGATASSQFFGIRGSGNTRDAFSIGSSLSNLSRKFGFNANITDIPLETTYYMYGGGSGANLDIRASTNPTEQDQAIVEMQSGDFETTFQSTWLRQVGSRSTDSDIITGMTIAGMGMLRFQSTSKSVISTTSDTLDGSNALQIWTDNAKILQFTKTGVNYASDFSASNTSNPRWLTDKGFVDGRLATGQTIDANTTGNAETATAPQNATSFKTALATSLQDVTSVGNTTPSSVSIGHSNSPMATLDVRGSAINVGDEATYSAKFSNGSGKGLIVGYDTSNNRAVISSINPTVAWTDIVVNPNGGNLAIGGNFTPLAKLDVSGSARASANDGNANTLVRNTDLATGWAVYNDTAYTSGSPFLINSGVTSTLPNNAGTSITTQLPLGVTSLYNSGTSKITPQLDGDYYVTTIRFKAITTAPSAGYVDFGIDIGGALGVQFKETKIFAKGAGIEHQFAFVVPMYSAATFIANGGLVKLTAGSGNMSVYDISFHIDRVYKAK